MANIKPKEEKKSFMIRVRVTTAEHEKFQKKASEEGYRSVSGFIRSLIADEQEENDRIGRESYKD